MAIQSSEHPPGNSSSSVSSFADRLQSQGQQNPITAFIGDSDGPTREAFLSNFSLPGRPPSEILHSQPALKNPSILSSSNTTASMAHSRQTNGPESVTSSAFMPSLVRSGTSTSDTSSISTDMASELPGMPLLSDAGDGLLERRDMPALAMPTFPCAFSFLNCTRTFHDDVEWREHCLSHFRGLDPPRSVQCPLCDGFRGDYSNGRAAWEARLEHMAEHHVLGHTLRTARPDFPLFQQLWQKRLINDAQYKELMGGNHTLSGPYAPPFTVTQGRRQDERRQGGPRNPPGGTLGGAAARRQR